MGLGSEKEWKLQKKKLQGKNNGSKKGDSKKVMRFRAD